MHWKISKKIYTFIFSYSECKNVSIKMIITLLLYMLGVKGKFENVNRKQSVWMWYKSIYNSVGIYNYYYDTFYKV